MRQIPLFIAILFWGGLSIYAQSAIVPVGGDVLSSSGSVSYSVGQIAVENANNNNLSVTEGVQQPYEILTVGVDDYPQIVLNAVVYPNPTDNIALLQLNGFEIPSGGLRAILYDGNGKMLQTSSVTEDLTHFQIGHYATGTYYFELRDGRRVLKSFKIIRK